MTKYYALGAASRRGIMRSLSLTNLDTLKVLPGILSSTDPFPTKDDFYARPISQDDAAALLEEYFKYPRLHPLLFPVSFVVREKSLWELVADRYKEYTPRYIEYEKSRFDKLPTEFRDRLLEMLAACPSMLKSRIGTMSIPHNPELYWNATDAWKDLRQGSGNRKLAIISLLDPSSSSDADKPTLENIKGYIGKGPFAENIRRLFGEDPMSAYKHLHGTLSKFFSKRPEMMAFWHARLVYSILYFPNVDFKHFATKRRSRVLVEWLLIAHNLELLPPMYLERIVQTLARNGVNCGTWPTGDYEKGLAYAQELAPLSNSIWGECSHATKQWSIFLHQNSGGIRWPSFIGTVEEAEEFWGDYEGNLRHAIPAFTELPCFVNFYAVTCNTVRCLVEESVKLYKSVGKWSTKKVFFNRASTRLWATRFLHTCQTCPLSTSEVSKLFTSGTNLRKILAKSNFFEYIPQELAQRTVLSNTQTTRPLSLREFACTVVIALLATVIATIGFITYLESP